MRGFLLSVVLSALMASSASASSLFEPQLHFSPGKPSQPRVALTLDACSGDIDHRILDVLVKEEIHATIFVTARWLAKNAEAADILKRHPELFEIEDHGRNHVPAVTGSVAPYGIKPAGTLQAVSDEVLGGAEAIAQFFGTAPTWFRGATALYTDDAIQEIVALGFRVAGFSLNADMGASVDAKTAERRLGAAKDGDVIIAHINQPKRPAGAGIAQGIMDLKKQGFVFVRLNDVDAK
ncbi:polysaccharide deacetylase family protein [Devosia epidermidihirudinis]|uniref:polysaccharide deacetylase family protein n=1 Tax=Devosia epidermidihirudinis TaxID=1293439 RepID=UPI000696864B|nr:polysaccharide deacetylase family protein [Devosia epidermidihirudinis]